MFDSLRYKLTHAWDAFKDTANEYRMVSYDTGHISTHRPDRVRMSLGNERSTIAPILNRIAMDVAGINVQHIKTDKNDRYLETLDTELNQRLNLEANLDQTGRAFMQDAALSLFDEGCIALVPIETSMDPKTTESYKIHSLRVGEIMQWFPKMVTVRVYNENTGLKEDITLPKNMLAIIENPLYAVMNEPNSTLRRLIDKLNLLDVIDNQSGSGKLDLIIQLPYIIKTAARKLQAEERRKNIEDQLSGSKYGIAYTDGTEKVTQLNRPTENNLMGQVEYLTRMLYSQLGITESVFDGTADEKTMLNYYNRTIEPVISAITDEMNRKFLTKTARSQKQKVSFIRDPFKLVPVNELANIADKFTRNEVLSSNDVRAIVGYRPSNDPSAEELRNKNIPKTDLDQYEDKIKKGEDTNGKEEI